MRQCIMCIPTGHQHIIACKARATSPAYCPEKVISSQDHTINCPSHWLLLKREKKIYSIYLIVLVKKKVLQDASDHSVVCLCIILTVREG